MTKSDFGLQDRRRLLVKLFWLVLAVLFLWLFGLGDVLQDRLGELGAAVVAFICLFGAVFLWNVIDAPRALQLEADEHIERLQNALDDRDQRQKAMVRLWKLRKEGVPHRNMHVTTQKQYETWHITYEKWRSKVLREANKISPNFKAWLETLDRMGAGPRMSSQSMNSDHHRERRIMSEILVRIEEFLKAAMLKKDIE